MNNRIDEEVIGYIRQFIYLIRDKFDIHEVYLFGSYARSEQNEESDIDVAVVIKNEKLSLFEILALMSDAAFDLEYDNDFKFHLSACPVFLEKWLNPENTNNPQLYYNIIKDGIKIDFF